MMDCAYALPGIGVLELELTLSLVFGSLGHSFAYSLQIF